MSEAAYEKKVLVSTTGTGGWLEIPCTSPSLDFNGDVLDSTELETNQGFRTRLIGLLDWSVSCDAMYEAGHAGLERIRTSMVNRTALYVQYLPQGTTAGGYQGQVVAESFNLGGGVGDLATVSISLQGNGPLEIAS